MRSMTDEGFVWLDDSEQFPIRGVVHVRSVQLSVPPLSSQASPVVAPPNDARMEGRPAVGLTRWPATRGRSFSERLVSVARSTVRGRPTLLGACIQFTDAISFELRLALQGP